MTTPETRVRCIRCDWEGTYEQLNCRWVRRWGEPLCPVCGCDEIEEIEEMNMHEKTQIGLEKGQGLAAQIIRRLRP